LNINVLRIFYGRVTQATESISGDQNLTTSYGYDSWGHNTSVTYPSGIVISNLYNPDGYLNEIKNSGTSIWKLDEINSNGQPIQYSLGSSGLKTNFEYDTKGFLTKKTTGQGTQSFDFDPYTGNLESRGYKNDTLTESFTYDELNRLYTSKVGSTEYTINYSNNGNITYRTDIGYYSYDSSQKNAVIGISNNPGTITKWDSSSYTPSNMTSSVYDSPYEVNFTYCPDNQRIKSVLKLEGTPQKTKYYSGSYEKEVTGSGTRHLHYISCPYGLVAVLIKEGETTTTWYTETDHLGSIIGLMNTSGAYVEQFSYDPWGRRRNPTDWTFNNVPDPTLLDRGFTGHEHLDKLGLINMNGRMYDPILGRFLGVDPIIQFPDNSQSFNGYSYCLNNPLKYTDPSGYLYNPGFNSALWQMIMNAWYSTIDGEDRSFTSNSSGGLQSKRISGHWERETVKTTGGIHGNYLNDETKLNVIDNVQIIEKWVWDNPGKDPIDLYLSTYGESPRAGDYIDPDAINGIGGTLDLLNRSADKSLKPVKIGTSAAGVVVAFLNGYLILSDKTIQGNLSWGDKGRAGLNTFFGIADAAVAFVGLVPAVLDSFGFFEPFYQTLDIWEETGYWVYYNIYTNEFQKIKIKP
jgi:RHS repeat-associated protein